MSDAKRQCWTLPELEGRLSRALVLLQEQSGLILKLELEHPSTRTQKDVSGTQAPEPGSDMPVMELIDIHVEEIISKINYYNDRLSSVCAWVSRDHSPKLPQL